jgi:hypothetical protein
MPPLDCMHRSHTIQQLASRYPPITTPSPTQDWALSDLVRVAEGAPGCAGRLSALFSDETGQSGWVPLVKLCLTEISDLTALAAAGAAAAGGGGGGGGGGPKWNAVKWGARGGGAGGGAAREEVMGEWHVRSRYHRVSCCLRALSGLAAASLTKDGLGVAQLSSPGLGDAAVGLLAAVVVLRDYVKVGAVSGW